MNLPGLPARFPLSPPKAGAELKKNTTTPTAQATRSYLLLLLHNSIKRNEVIPFNWPRSSTLRTSFLLATQMADAGYPKMPAQMRPSISTSSSRVGGGSLGGSSSLPYMSSSHLSPTLTPQQYLQRMVDLQQMDLQSAIDQMRTLLSLYPQRVYKMAYYRKQTKNHWARDDPAFCFVQVVMVVAFSIAYGFAFRVSSLSAMLGFVAKSVLIHWLLFGVFVASVGRLVANQHLMMSERSPSHVKQDVEWLYAFDVHCNAFVPLFVLLCELILLLSLFGRGGGGGWTCTVSRQHKYLQWRVAERLLKLLRRYSNHYSMAASNRAHAIRNFRCRTIFLVAASIGDFPPVDGVFQYLVCCSIWMVFLHNSFGL